MPYYKDSATELHWLSPEDVELGATSLLPQGAVEITDDEAAALLNPAPTLEAAKESKLAAIQAEKVRVRDGGITVDGVLFDTDQHAMDAYTRTQLFVFSSTPSASIEAWKASEGVWVTMTAGLLAQLIQLGLANEAAAFAWQQAREMEVETATTVAEVLAISETYGA